jgi:hypothetical protein
MLESESRPELIWLCHLSRGDLWRNQWLSLSLAEQGKTSGLIIVSTANFKHGLRSRYEVVVVSSIVLRKRCLCCYKSSVLSGCLIHHCLS